MLAAVAALLSAGGDETALLAVETLTSLLRHCAEHDLARAQPQLAALLLDTWTRRWEDPALASALVRARVGAAATRKHVTMSRGKTSL